VSTLSTPQDRRYRKKIWTTRQEKGDGCPLALLYLTTESASELAGKVKKTVTEEPPFRL